MGHLRQVRLDDERLTLLALWSTPGVGRKSIEKIKSSFQGLGQLLHEPVGKWVGAVDLPEVARAGLRKAGVLMPVAERVLNAAWASNIHLTFLGDPEFPEGLVQVPSSPPVLFYWGHWSKPMRRVAMVGTRYTSQSVLEMGRRLAERLASLGLCVVSGAAEGVDQACHQGALAVKGETWAFMGAGLDQLDPAQKALVPAFMEGRGLMFSEFPPGVRADRFTFPRRNRLISGASHVVVVVRAGASSGALHTARYAKEQGRPVLALPAELSARDAQGNFELLQGGKATLCLGPQDVLNAMGMDQTLRLQPREEVVLDFDELSEDGRLVFDALKECTLDLDELLGATKLSSSALSSALCELELAGLVLTRPGKRYERL